MPCRAVKQSNTIFLVEKQKKKEKKKDRSWCFRDAFRAQLLLLQKLRKLSSLYNSDITT